MAVNFDLDFHGTKFTVAKANLIKFFLHRPEVFPATTYEVQSSVPLEIFEVFVRALDSGAKVPVTPDNSSAISSLAKEFYLEDLVAECSALRSSSTPDLIAALSERVSTLEHHILLHIQVIVPGLQKLIEKHDRQLETLISSIEATTTYRTEIDNLRHSIELVHGDLKTFKSKSTQQLQVLCESIGTFEGKISDSLSPVVGRLSACEEELKSLPRDSSPTKKPRFPWTKASPSPVPKPIPIPISRNFDAWASEGVKLLIVGGIGVGKSEIMTQFVTHEFDDRPLPTMSPCFATKVIEVHKHHVKLNLWDTPGEGRCWPITLLYCKGVVGALAVYNITSSDSFASMGRWLEDLRKEAHPHAAIVLIGNRADREEARAVSFEEGKSFAQREHLLFIETSAKDATNIIRAFEMLTAEVIARYEKGDFDDTPSANPFQLKR